MQNMSLVPHQTASYGYFAHEYSTPMTVATAPQYVRQEVTDFLPSRGSANPFAETKTAYVGTVGQPNAARPILRPAKDRLDRLVSCCLDKLDMGINQINTLAGETQRMQQQLRNSNTGGNPELRHQLKRANVEIHRLRTLLAEDCGRADEDNELPGEQADGSMEEMAPADTFPRPRD
eukprot:NODE_8178_length_718_cov_153.294118_g7926_i0.p1 GENE.NODE_8178_length_718_cov_153.294118_g7926_i0~~NODE_8178_length_718_cov_153.294118_g7926_i0.p1  ORF type:complete len:195 (+),score=49.02 NODE_8178_length_718_cov_153.294118_g7926_i0:56-586(+)